MTSRPRVKDDAAVSSVLGAIMLFGIFVITMVTVQVQFVPVWDEDREARHMDEVTGQLSQLVSDIDRQVQNDTTVSLSDPLRLERQGGFQFFSLGERLPSSLSFESAPVGAGVSLASPRMTIFELDGQELTAIADQASWIDLDGVADDYVDIANLRVLRVRIPWPADTNDCNVDLTATLHIYDVNGDELARVIHTCHDASGERSINTQVFYRETTASGFGQVSGDTEAIFQNADADFFFIDLMRSELLLGPILASLDGPLTMEMDDGGLAADYVLVYDDTSGGTVGGGPGLVGKTVAPYPATPTEYEGGRLAFAANNQRFVDQQYVVEHGAVLRVQSEGAAIVVPPRFDVRPTTSQTRIDWNLPTLKGESQSLGGASLATVTSDRAGPGLTMLAGAGELTIELPTAYPDAWRSFLGREMLESGLAPSEYSFPSSTTSVILTITGTSTDPADDDLLLEFGQADINIDLASSG